MSLTVERSDAPAGWASCTSTPNRTAAATPSPTSGSGTG